MTLKTNTKTCTKCHIIKSLDEFHNKKSGKCGKSPHCKKCKSETDREYCQSHREEIAKQRKLRYEENREEVSIKGKEYRQLHREEIKKRKKVQYEKTGRQKRGCKSMYDNKDCSQYLGVVIGERLCRHLFKDVEVMPNGNSGYDIVCNRGKKIDVKTSSTHFRENGKPYWSFTIGNNKIADFFILVAFDNRTDLNPLHMWMIPGYVLNENTGTSIASSTIHKWDEWKHDIEDAQLCCAELKHKIN